MLLDCQTHLFLRLPSSSCATLKILNRRHQFNLNVLEHINHELGADFNIGAFEHDARWLVAEACVEMHLVSRADQTVHVGGRTFQFKKGESIQTEMCRKYTLQGFKALAESAGWTTEAVWTDGAQLFAVHFLRACSLLPGAIS